MLATAALADRPNGKGRHILEAAGQLFMEHGYGATSMDSVARRARVSKATLYAHFTGKEQLFAAIVSAECQRLSDAIAAHIGEEDELRATLLEFGRRFAGLIYSPRGIAMYRIVVAEAPRFPELGRIFYESGPRMVVDRFAEYLARARSRGLVTVDAPREAAAQFIGHLRGEQHLRLLLGIDSAIRQEELDAIIERATELFCRLHVAAG